MKAIKPILKIFILILLILINVFSLGSLLCKYSDLPETSFIQVFGYLSYHWVLLISGLVIVLLLIIRKRIAALFFAGLMILFAIFLNDFSLKFISHKLPGDIKPYHSIKVAAYNVKYYSYGIDNIAKYIKESDIDVFLLSESVLSPEKLEWMKSNVTGFSMYTDGGNDLSVLSRYPVVKCNVIELPTYLASLSSSNDIDKLKESGIHRSFVHVILNINGSEVNLLSLRLIAGRPKEKTIPEEIRWGKYLLWAQNAELSVFLTYMRSLKGPVIFGGDLNSPPNSRIIRQINKYVDDSYPETHFIGSYTFKASMPSARLDFIFHSKDVKVISSRVVNAHLSDHFMIRTEFLIPAN